MMHSIHRSIKKQEDEIWGWPGIEDTLVISLFPDLPHLHFFFYLQLCCPSYCEQSNTGDREGLHGNEANFAACFDNGMLQYLSCKKEVALRSMRVLYLQNKTQSEQSIDHKQMEVPFLQSYIQNFQTIIQTLLTVLACVCISTQPKATNSCTWSTRSCIVQ